MQFSVSCLDLGQTGKRLQTFFFLISDGAATLKQGSNNWHIIISFISDLTWWFAWDNKTKQKQDDLFVLQKTVALSRICAFYAATWELVSSHERVRVMWFYPRSVEAHSTRKKSIHLQRTRPGSVPRLPLLLVSETTRLVFKETALNDKAPFISFQAYKNTFDFTLSK